MTNQRDLELQIQDRNSSFAIALKPKRGEVVEVNGSIEGDLPYLVWVKPLDTNASPTQMFNPGTVQSLQSGMTVYYRQDPEAPAPWSLVRFDSATYAQDASAFLSLPGVNNPPHANEHIMTPGLVGPDPLNVYSHALVDFAVRPTTPASMRVRVYSGWYPGVTNYELFTGPTNTKDFTSDIPATSGKAILVAICIDSVGVLTYVNGTDYTEGEPIPAASRPSVATNLLLITAIRLVNGMTEITNASFDHEMRPVFAPGGLSRTIDAAKVSQLISPDGSIIPVIAAADDGDVTAENDILLGNTARGRIQSLLFDFPLVDTGSEGSHFLDNDSSFPAGWTESDAADDTSTDVLYSTWYLQGASTETSWKYRIQTSTDLETDIVANASAVFLVGPLQFKDGNFTADVDYYFGIYRNNGGVIDENTFCRIHLQWDSAGGVWQIRGEVKDSSSGTQHDGTYEVFSVPLNNRVWIALAVQNAATKRCLNYYSPFLAKTSTTAPSNEFMTNLQSQLPTTALTWGDIWVQFHQTRGAGSKDRVLIGALDRLS